jgi:hypothetical protein
VPPESWPTGYGLKSFLRGVYGPVPAGVKGGLPHRCGQARRAERGAWAPDPGRCRGPAWTGWSSTAPTGPGPSRSRDHRGQPRALGSCQRPGGFIRPVGGPACRCSSPGLLEPPLPDDPRPGPPGRAASRSSATVPRPASGSARAPMTGDDAAHVDDEQLLARPVRRPAPGPGGRVDHRLGRPAPQQHGHCRSNQASGAPAAATSRTSGRVSALADGAALASGRDYVPSRFGGAGAIS